MKIQENYLIFGDFGNLGLVGEVTHSSFYTGLESDQGGGGRYSFFSKPISVTPRFAKNKGTFWHFLATPIPPSPMGLIGLRMAVQYRQCPDESNECSFVSLRQFKHINVHKNSKSISITPLHYTNQISSYLSSARLFPFL